MRSILRHQPANGRRRTRLQPRLFHRRASGPAAVRPTTDADFAAQRVRAAGGPTDEASYTCACGYVFCAPVSATVACPRCGSEQAW
jgi:hypothetical protein